jgi:hypothetical protein
MRGTNLCDTILKTIKVQYNLPPTLQNNNNNNNSHDSWICKMTDNGMNNRGSIPEMCRSFRFVTTFRSQRLRDFRLQPRCK